MTILQCVNNLDVGGAEHMALRLATGLQKRGHRSLICCIEARGALADQAEAAGIPVYALHLSQAGKLSALRSFSAFLRQSRTPTAANLHHRDTETTEPSFSESSAASVVNSPALASQASVSGLRSQVSALSPVILHSHNFKPFYYCALASFLHAASGHIHTRHGTFIRQHRGLWRYRLLRRHVDRLVTVSADRQGEMAKLAGVASGSVNVIPNGVDVAQYAPRGKGQEASGKHYVDQAASLFPLPSSHLTIVTVARLSPEKDQKTLLRAFKIVLERCSHAAPPACTPNAATERRGYNANNQSEVCGLRSEVSTKLPRLVVVGDGPCRSELETETRTLGIAGQVDFLGVRSDIPELLQSADVFALSSLSEGQSMSLIEALACGLPSVVTNVGGNPEIVDETCGLLVRPQDSSALAAALLRLLHDAFLRERLGQAARQRAVTHFSLDTMVDRYLGLYQEAAGTKAE